MYEDYVIPSQYSINRCIMDRDIKMILWLESENIIKSNNASCQTEWEKTDLKNPKS